MFDDIVSVHHPKFANRNITMEADKDIVNELNKYTSSFDTFDSTGKLSKTYLKLRRDQLILALVKLETKTDHIRHRNAISFLHFLIGDINFAFEVNKVILEDAPDNIIGLSNHARFLHSQQERISEIKKDCAKLSELCKDPYKMVIAKSEVAFTYFIFGTMFSKKAGQLFQEVLIECNKPERVPEEFEDNIILWSFGCALAYKRLLNVGNVHKKADLDLSKQNYITVGKLCSDIIARESQSSVCAIFCSRAYVLLAELAHDLRGMFLSDIKDIIPDNPNLHMQVEDYLERALSPGHGDSCVFVLERCGEQFRYLNQLDRSIELLEEATKIKPNGFNHYHLALSLIQKLEYTSKSKPGRQTDRVRRTNNPQHAAYEKEATALVALPEMKTTKLHQSQSVGISKTDKEESVHSLEKQASELSMNDNTEKLPGIVGSFSSYQRYIKSPKPYKMIDPDGNEDLLKSVEFHLDKSFEINMNLLAMYDKGYLKRQIGQLDEAIKIFKSLMRDEHGQCSHIVVANAYEQTGLCLDELLCRPNRYSTEDEEDMVMYFKKSIEISCNIVAKVPALQTCWTSAPTLLSFLKRQSETKYVLNDLEFLYRKMNDYGGAVDVLNKLLELAEEEGEKTEIILKLIKSHLANNRIDDAVLAFDFIKCLPKWHERVDKEVYLKVHIEGAFHAFKMGENTVAELRFENAFDFCKGMSKGQEIITDRQLENGDRGVEQFDIFILYDSANDIDETNTNAAKLHKTLETVGLTITRNTEDIIGGKLKTEGIAEVMEMSKHFIVMYDTLPTESRSDKELVFYASVMNEIITKRKHGNVMVLVPTNIQHLDLPTVFAGYQKSCFDFDSEEHGELKLLLISLAMGSE